MRSAIQECVNAEAAALLETYRQRMKSAKSADKLPASDFYCGKPYVRCLLDGRDARTRIAELAQDREDISLRDLATVFFDTMLVAIDDRTADIRHFVEKRLRQLGEELTKDADKLARKLKRERRELASQLDNAANEAERKINTARRNIEWLEDLLTEVRAIIKI